MQRVRAQIGLGAEQEINGGAGIVIGVLDTGMGRHPDLEGRLLDFRDFTGKKDKCYDDNGHGTHVCGILCGSGELSQGKYRGIAPQARLVVGKVLDENGDGIAENMLNGLDWILEVQKKYHIRILNISVGIGTLSEERKEVALCNKLEKICESGILVVCAAGNKGPGDGTISGLGASSRVLTVGCHDGKHFKHLRGRCETYSGRGKSGNALRKPDLVAPGTNIVSCNLQGGYIAKSGTSMATPIVSGAAALFLQKYPDVSNEMCKQRMKFSATDLGIPWNRQGWGMVNVRRLLQ